MPSFLFGGRSGGDLVISGTFWSGRAAPVTGIQFKVDRSASGNLYLGFSGGITVKSGGFFLSGGGLMDGMQLGPGEAYLVPKGALLSGPLNIYVAGDLAASGFAQMYWEGI